MWAFFQHNLTSSASTVSSLLFTGCPAPGRRPPIGILRLAFETDKKIQWDVYHRCYTSQSAEVKPPLTLLISSYNHVYNPITRVPKSFKLTQYCAMVECSCRNQTFPQNLLDVSSCWSLYFIKSKVPVWKWAAGYTDKTVRWQTSFCLLRPDSDCLSFLVWSLLCGV